MMQPAFSLFGAHLHGLPGHEKDLGSMKTLLFNMKIRLEILRTSFLPCTWHVVKATIKKKKKNRKKEEKFRDFLCERQGELPQILTRSSCWLEVFTTPAPSCAEESCLYCEVVELHGHVYLLSPWKASWISLLAD